MYGSPEEHLNSCALLWSHHNFLTKWVEGGGGAGGWRRSILSLLIHPAQSCQVASPVGCEHTDIMCVHLGLRKRSRWLSNVWMEGKNDCIKQYDLQRLTAGDTGAFNLLFCLGLSSSVWCLAVFCIDLQNDKEHSQGCQTHTRFMN